MYWVEENDSTIEIPTLSNIQLVDNLMFMERKFEFFYCRELRKLEKQKAEAIIRNLDEFQEAQKKYHYLKSQSPEVWFENWEVYKSFLNEIKKRNLAIPQHANTPTNMLCFG
jgi:hypothetical protein